MLKKRELRRVTLVILPNSTSYEVGLTIKALKTANLIASYSVFTWQIATLDGQAIELDDEFVMQPQIKVGEDEAFDLALIYGGEGFKASKSLTLINWLKRLDRQGVYLGTIGRACHELASANLLNGYQCSIPIVYHDSFRELFPSVGIQDALYTWDRNRITCTGHVASLDMVLNVIKHRCGAEIVSQVAETLNHQVRKESSINHRNLILEKMSGKLAKAVRVMEDNIEIPFTSEEIAAEIETSKRQVERLFARHLKSTPRRYYNGLRLKRARSLLRQTSLTVSEISVACGFASFSHFSKAYRGYFGTVPRKDRSLSSTYG
ncbi:GlxA family transcriptional regulator [Kiloniella sp.]|uniref:GlxA family transcriptional regulator n=1 Tax=Kiloniella sp. TaxID=1938587 RepID=UPI003B01E4C5